MPTGYTSDVRSGKITEFPDFALQCARAFGALIVMRDEPHDKPIPKAFEPETSYYDEQISRSQATIADLGSLSDADCERRALAAHADAVEAVRARIHEREEDRDRYQAMVAKVEAWTPPTDDHEEMKNFMLQQLNESIRFDCTPYADLDKEPALQSGREWREAMLAQAARDLSYGLEHRQQEIERTNKRNQWLTDLRNSL